MQSLESLMIVSPSTTTAAAASSSSQSALAHKPFIGSVAPIIDAASMTGPQTQKSLLAGVVGSDAKIAHSVLI